MDIHIAIEQAYKNGYTKGCEDSTKHGWWEEQSDGTHYCSQCGRDATYTYDRTEVCSLACPYCGTIMDKKKTQNQEGKNNK